MLEGFFHLRPFSLLTERFQIELSELDRVDTVSVSEGFNHKRLSEGEGELRRNNNECEEQRQTEGLLNEALPIKRVRGICVEAQTQ